MINTFLGTSLAIITVFGLILPTWHWLSMSWKDSEQKGTNPYVGGMFGLFAGYMIGFAIVGSFFILTGLLGIDGRLFNCYNFSGGDKKICQEAYPTAYENAKKNGTLPEDFEKAEKEIIEQEQER